MEILYCKVTIEVFLGRHSFPYQSLLLCSTIIHNDKSCDYNKAYQDVGLRKTKSVGSNDHTHTLV